MVQCNRHTNPPALFHAPIPAILSVNTTWSDGCIKTLHWTHLLSAGVLYQLCLYNARTQTMYSCNIKMRSSACFHTIDSFSRDNFSFHDFFLSSSLIRVTLPGPVTPPGTECPTSPVGLMACYESITSSQCILPGKAETVPPLLSVLPV